MKKRIIYFLLALLLFSCRKEQDLSTIDLGYDFFPNKVGSYIIYEVDSTYYGITESNFHYQIKEELSAEFIDGDNQPANIINRYYRSLNNQPWVLIDVWSQKRTTNTAEKVVENVRYIKMEFPVKDGGTWNGNALNNFPEEQYKYAHLNQFADVGILQFPKTVTVEQRNNVNFVDNEVFYEIYALGVGMVFRQATDLNTQGAQVTGYDVSYRAISYTIE